MKLKVILNDVTLVYDLSECGLQRYACWKCRMIFTFLFCWFSCICLVQGYSKMRFLCGAICTHCLCAGLINIAVL